MRKMLILLTTVLAAPALAQIPTPEAKAPDGNEVICRAKASTGSRLKREKVCMTATEWEESRRNVIKAISDKQHRQTEIRSR